MTNDRYDSIIRALASNGPRDWYIGGAGCARFLWRQSVDGIMQKQQWVRDFRPRPDKPLCRQITEYLRDLIRRDVLKPGTRLLPLRELADQWDTNYFTVQSAMSPLVDEGLLVRTPRLGTFVRERESTLEHVGIYVPQDIFSDPNQVYYAVLESALSRRLSQEGVRSTLWVDERPAVQRREPLPELMEAVRERVIQGLILPLMDDAIGAWLDGQKIAKAFTGSGEETGCVRTDVRGMARLALKHLAESGCRDVGAICHLPPVWDDPKAQGYAEAQVYAEFLSAASEMGLKAKRSWIFAPDTYPDQLERAGYDLFKEFQTRRKKPAGLFVFPDIVARGVVGGVLEAGMRVPEEVRLVLHKNAEVEVFCPLSVAWVVTNVADCAEALIRQVRNQVAGKAGNAETVSSRLEVQAAAGRLAGKGR